MIVPRLPTFMKTQMTPIRLQRGCDRLAITLAGACGIHCLLTPVLLIAFPILAGSFFVGEAFHYWMLGATLPATTLAACLGCRKHRDGWVAGWAIGGLSILFFAAFLGHEVAGEAGERILTVLGGILLATGHVRNFRLCRQADCLCHAE